MAFDYEKYMERFRNHEVFEIMDIYENVSHRIHICWDSGNSVNYKDHYIVIVPDGDGEIVELDPGEIIDYAMKVGLSSDSFKRILEIMEEL